MFNRLLQVATAALMLFAFCVFHTAMAAPLQPPQSIIDQLQSTYQQLQSLQFDFFQVADTNGRIREARGHATFYRPSTSKDKNLGIMRWDYTEPTPQVILNNGLELIIYTPQDKQLIVSRVDDLESDITSALFIGTKKLTEEFTLHPPDPFFLLSTPLEGTQSVQLIPRQPHAQLKRLQLWMDQNHRLQRLLLEDHFGALTELTFSRIRFNELKATDSEQEQLLLQLDLVPGTEIIRQ
jgi:outer membrane lipoprotein carrier protein